MPYRTHIIRSIARAMRRWCPGAESIAGAVAMAGDPLPLLDLEAERRRRGDARSTA